MNEKVKQIIGEAPVADLDSVAAEEVKQPADQKREVEVTNQKRRRSLLGIE